MIYNAADYVHKSDLKAMKALKLIPGFKATMKTAMNLVTEKRFKVINMANRIRVQAGQMDEYYKMLPPICEKLGIDVPEMYVEMNPEPNAYTYGDTEPFVVLTSGMINTVPKELLPSVIAHECGHIACHHTLYHTMGQYVVNSSAYLPGMVSLLSIPLQVAYYYWSRCSELSADRAAVLCDEDAEKMVDVCMYLAGYNKQYGITISRDAFLKQAKDYREMIAETMSNKMTEMLMSMTLTHPFTAIRALEAVQWADSAEYRQLRSGMGSSNYHLNAIALNTLFAKEYMGGPMSETVFAANEVPLNDYLKIGKGGEAKHSASNLGTSFESVSGTDLGVTLPGFEASDMLRDLMGKAGIGSSGFDSLNIEPVQMPQNFASFSADSKQSAPNAGLMPDGALNIPELYELYDPTEDWM